MPDDDLIRIGFKVDTGTLKAGLAQAVAITRAQLGHMQEQYRQAFSGIRQSVESLGAAALASEVDATQASLAQVSADYRQTAANIESSLSGIADAQAALGADAPGIESLRAIRRQMEADIAEQRAVLEQLRSAGGFAPPPGNSSVPRPASAEREAPAEPPLPLSEAIPSPRSGVVNLPPREIQADPARFQFKANTGGAAGVGEELKSVQKFDPELAGVVAVWKDPEDGKTYVVNGHHRLELANRTGAENITARYIDAATAGEARIKGALINIAEGRGTSVDAAKVFRDGGFTPENLASKGVSLRGSVAREGMALSRLAPSLFDQVVQGNLAPQRGAVIGENLESHDEQKSALDLLGRAEARGKRPTNSEVKELIDFVKGGPKEEVQSSQASLFGDDTIQKNLALEKAEISDSIRRRLSQERRLFSTTGTASAAEQLGQAGNVIKPEENARLADQAAQAAAVYDKLKTSAGPINDVLNASARQLASGNAQQVKSDAYERVRQAISDTLRGTESASAPGDRRVSESAGAAPPEPAREAQPRPAPEPPHEQLVSEPARVAAPPAAPPPPPPAAPPTGPPPDDGEEERRKRELTARREQAQQEQQLTATVAASDKQAAAETATAEEAAIARVEAARRQMAEQRSKPLSSATIDADLELHSAEQELAAIRQNAQQEAAATSQSAEERQQALRRVAQTEEQTAEQGRQAVASSAQADSSAVQRSAGERKAAIAGVGTVAVDTAAQTSAAVAEAAAASSAATQQAAADSTAGALEASEAQKAGQIEAVEQAVAAQEEAAATLRSRLQGIASGIAASFKDAWRSATGAAEESFAQQTEAAAQAGRAELRADAGSKEGLRAQLKQLKSEKQTAVQEEEAAYERLADIQAIYAQKAAAGQREAIAVMEQYTAELNAAKAETQQLSLAIDRVAAALNEVSAAAAHTVPEMSAASSAIRVFDDKLPIRAVERFVTSVLGLGPILQAAFPVIGAVAMGEMLVDVAGKVHDLYENYVNLKDIQEQVEQVELRLAKATESSFQKEQELAVEHLKHIGDLVGAAQREAQNLESKPFDLQQFLSDKAIEKDFKSLPKEMQQQFKDAFGDIIPHDLTAKIGEVTKKMNEAAAAAAKMRELQASLANTPAGPYGGGGNVGAELYEQHQAEQQEAAGKLYGGLLQALGQFQHTYRAETLKGQDGIDEALGRKIIEDTEKQISLLKQRGQYTAAAEKEAWQQALAQVPAGDDNSSRQIESKLGSLSTRKGAKDDTAQLMRKADEDTLAEMRLNAAETGQAHDALLAEEEAFVRRRLALEKNYADNLRALRTELVRIEQDQERSRIKKDDAGAAKLITPEGKPDYAAQLDYWNRIAASAGDAKNAVEEANNAVDHAQRAGAEAIRQTNEDVKHSVEQQYEAWIAAGHRTEAEIEKFWADVKSRYASDAPLVEEAVKKITEALVKQREETLKLKEIQAEREETEALGGLQDQKIAVQQRYELHPPASLNPLGQTPQQKERQELGQIDLQEIQVKQQTLSRELEAAKQEFGQESVQYQQLALKKEQTDQQYAQKKKQLDHQQTIDQIQNVRKLVQQIDHEWLNGINQWIQGQKTFAQAMAQSWNSMVMDILKFIEEIGIRWLEEHVIMAAVEAVFGSSLAASTAKNNATNVAKASSDAAVAAAATLAYYSASAPEIAPAMAELQYAIGMGFAGMAALDTGGYIPKDGMAMLHQGEVVVNHPITQMLGQMATAGNAYSDQAQAIVPAQSAPGLFRSSAASSSAPSLHPAVQQMMANAQGGDTHFHAHVTSSPTFHGAKDPDMKALLSEHADHIGRLVNRQMKQFNR